MEKIANNKVSNHKSVSYVCFVCNQKLTPMLDQTGPPQCNYAPLVVVQQYPAFNNNDTTRFYCLHCYLAVKLN